MSNKLQGSGLNPIGLTLALKLQLWMGGEVFWAGREAPSNSWLTSLPVFVSQNWWTLHKSANTHTHLYNSAFTPNVRPTAKPRPALRTPARLRSSFSAFFSAKQEGRRRRKGRATHAFCKWCKCVDPSLQFLTTVLL